MQRPNLSLRGLEIFLLAAKSGSMRQVAAETGLSISTVSHHLRGIQTSLGVSLLDHSRRPMVLTPAGTRFARHVEEGLKHIRRGETELSAGDLAQMRELRFGIVDDFDSEVAPELAQFLARAMPRSTFQHHTRPSHEIIRLLFAQKLDVGVATRPVTGTLGLSEYPVLRDPFVIALPASASDAPEDCLAGRSELPLLRYSHLQIIGNLIEAHLRRTRVSLESRFELESNQSLLGMVADGSGWAITTPASFARAKRFHDQIALHPYPGKGFARTVSLFSTELYPQATAEMIAGSLRRLVNRYFVEPISKNYGWLSPGFRSLETSFEAA